MLTAMKRQPSRLPLYLLLAGLLVTVVMVLAVISSYQQGISASTVNLQGELTSIRLTVEVTLNP